MDAVGTAPELHVQSLVAIVNYLLCSLIRESVVGFYHCPAEPCTLDSGERREFENSRECEFFLVRTKRAELVGKLFREHRHRAVYQIDGCAAGLCFLVDYGTRCNIIRYVRDMHADFIVPVAEFPERKRVIEVLGVFRVNRECQCIPEVLTSFKVLSCNLFRYVVSGVFHFRLEPVRQAVFRQDGVHLGVVFARLAKHVDQMSLRIRFSPVPAVDQRRHFKSAAHFQFLPDAVDCFNDSSHRKFPVAEFLQVSGFRHGALPAMNRRSVFVSYVNADVVWHDSALHEHPCLVPDHVEYTDERLARPLNYLCDNAFLSSSFCLFFRYRDFDNVAVQGSLGLALPYVDIIFHVLDLDEDESVPCHLDSASVHRIFLLLVIIFLAAFFKEAAAISPGPTSGAFPS